MRRGLGFLLVGLAAAFLLVFMVVPIVSLVLVGFTGQPVPILGNPITLMTTLMEKARLTFYVEFFTTRRYRQGLLNSVGLAPLLAVLVWLALRALNLILVRSGQTRTARALERQTLLWMALAAGSGLAFAVFWPYLGPLHDLGHALVPGKSWALRLIRALGFCPLVTLAATAVGVGVAFALTRTDMPGRHAFRILCIVPLALPTFLGALAFKTLLGDYGMVTRVLHSLHLSHPFTSQSALSAGLVQVFLFFPLVVLTTAAALDRMDPSLGEAASVMGARRAFAFWTVSLPVITPGIAAGAFLIFIRSFGDFAALSLLLPIKYPMIVLEAYRDMSGSGYWGGASMLSTWMIGVILTLLALQKYFVESGTYQTVTGRAGGHDKLTTNPVVRFGALLYCLAAFAVPLAFIGATMLISIGRNWGADIFPRAFTLSRYTRALAHLTEENSPLFNSFALVLPALVGTTVLAFLVSYLIARNRSWLGQLLDFVCMLPFVVPGVAFAVALIGAFNGPPLPLHLTVTLVIIAYVVTRVPYGVRSTLASFQQIGTSMEESSKTMGGTGVLTLFKVTVPLVMPGVMAGAIMVFISAMEDVAITLMVCPPRWYPASVYVYHEITQGNVFGASAYGVILMALVLIPYLIAYRLGGVRSTL